MRIMHCSLSIVEVNMAGKSTGEREKKGCCTAILRLLTEVMPVKKSDLSGELKKEDRNGS